MTNHFMRLFYQQSSTYIAALFCSISALNIVRHKLTEDKSSYICHTKKQKNMLSQTAWIHQIDDVERQLLVEADFLLDREKKLPKDPRIVDYGFLVYPAAKAYEGFLKTFFYKNGLIDNYMYKSDHFRIGKAINPDLPEKYREDGWVYDDLARLFGEDIPARFWSTWRKCRNHVFHFKPDKLRLYTLVEAQIKVELIFSTIALAIDRQQSFSAALNKPSNGLSSDQNATFPQ